MDIQAGIYATFQKVLDENGKEVWRRTGGGSSADLSAYPTREEMKAYAPRKPQDTDSYTLFHVDKSRDNAADVWGEGRGFSADNPFRTLGGAIKLVKQNFADSQQSSFALHSDQDLTGDIYATSNGMLIYSADPSNPVTLTVTDVTLNSGSFIVGNVNMRAAEGAKWCWRIVPRLSHAQLTFYHPVEFFGSVSEAVFVLSHAAVLMIEKALSGDITGSRYFCINGSRILTFGKADQLPGTIEGTCDETSIVV